MNTSIQELYNMYMGIFAIGSVALIGVVGAQMCNLVSRKRVEEIERNAMIATFGGFYGIIMLYFIKKINYIE